MTDYTARKEEVMNLIHDMEPADAVKVAVSILNTANCRHIIWSGDDIMLTLDSDFPQSNFTDGEKERIKDRAMQSYDWRTLSDVPEEHLEKINSAIWEAAGELGIDLNHRDS